MLRAQVPAIGLSVSDGFTSVMTSKEAARTARISRAMREDG
jgi:hypothetical protein